MYENDEMIDCFMDDIDEMSMIEGERHNQQDFNTNNAAGSMTNKKNGEGKKTNILDTSSLNS